MQKKQLANAFATRLRIYNTHVNKKQARTLANLLHITSDVKKASNKRVC